ncbi:hypothetical protein GHJ82_07025 [Sinorhizobium saheli]|nr:hypothetical protein [Sinorhizobium saheli]
MRSHAFAPPLHLFVCAAFVRRQVAPPDCKDALGRVDNYLIHKTMAAIVTTAR